MLRDSNKNKAIPKNKTQKKHTKQFIVCLLFIIVVRIYSLYFKQKLVEKENLYTRLRLSSLFLVFID